MSDEVKTAHSDNFKKYLSYDKARVNAKARLDQQNNIVAEETKIVKALENAKRLKSPTALNKHKRTLASAEEVVKQQTAIIEGCDMLDKLTEEESEMFYKLGLWGNVRIKRPERYLGILMAHADVMLEDENFKLLFEDQLSDDPDESIARDAFAAEIVNKYTKGALRDIRLN